MRSLPRIVAAVSLAASLCGCSLMNFDGLAAGPEGIGGSSGGLGLDHGGGGAGVDAGSSGGGTAGGATTAINLIVNADFEEGTSRWIPVGGCLLTVSSDTPHSGAACLRISNRAETWQGPGYDLTTLVQPNTSYRASVWVRAVDGSQTTQLTYKHRCEGETDYTYTPFGASRVTTEWTELSASFLVADCKAESLIYVEGPAAQADFYIDDTSVVLETP
jgi:hypothetical protein